MERVLIVGQDTALSKALCAVLEDAGYGVAVCSDTTLALALMCISYRPFVVLLFPDDGSHEQPYDGPAQAWTQVLAFARLLPRHAYILLSSQPQRAPWQWNPHTQAFVPIVPLPFDLKLLLTRVAEAVRRLRFVVASDRQYAADLQPYDTPTGRNLASSNVAKPVVTVATTAGVLAQEERARTPKQLLRARAGLVTARAVAVQALNAQTRALEAVTRAHAALALARAREAPTRRLTALAPIRDLAVGTRHAAL